ncbi:MAG: hypothetical protein J7578_10000 [Chitinophagaceae bacterium]|nr:hypothetical protein [Chitinophagaceae bacterium]
MPPATKTLRTCPNGHRYYKSSDCPVCPVCANGSKPGTGFLSLLYAPARRALENAGLTTAAKLAAHTEAEVLSLHGMGQKAMPILRQFLKEQGLTFKK